MHAIFIKETKMKRRRLVIYLQIRVGEARYATTKNISI